MGMELTELKSYGSFYGGLCVGLLKIIPLLHVAFNKSGDDLGVTWGERLGGSVDKAKVHELCLLRSVM